MRILLTNAAFEAWGGSELYARDVARGLRLRGHTPYLFSPFVGPLGEEMRGEELAVVDDLAALPAPPDLIHGQHHAATMAAIAFFPAAPAVYFCHGTRPWEEIPPHHPRIRRYVAVSENVAEHMIANAGVAPEAVEVVHNFVDTERFHARGPLPKRPRRALVFGNYIGECEVLVAIREACSRRGIDVEAVGASAGRPEHQPERILGGYDVVFAIGRAALEAMAVGATVILCNTEGLGEIVTASSFDRLAPGNFGRATLTRPATADLIERELRRYDPAVAIELRARVRGEASLQGALARIVAIYERALASAAPSLSAEEERAALHGYHRWAARAVRGRLVEPLSWAERQVAIQLARARAAELRQAELEELLGTEERAAASRVALAATRVDRSERLQAVAEERAAAAEERTAAAAQRLAALEDDIHAIAAFSDDQVSAALVRAEQAEWRASAVAEWASAIESSLSWRLARAVRRVPGALWMARALSGLARSARPAAAEPVSTSLVGDPELACVVLCHGGAPEVVDAVASLASQEGIAEVVVVNSEGEDPEPRLKAAGLKLTVLHREQRLLPGAARNLGVAATTAPYVAFLAADCVAEPGWAAARLARHRAGAPLVASAIVNAEPRNSAALAAHLALFARRMPRTPLKRALFYGVSYSRTLLEAVGPFREDLRAGEDTDHLARAAALARPVWAPEVRTAHRNPSSVLALLRDQRARGARAGCAYSRLNGMLEGRRVALDALTRWPSTLLLGLRSAGAAAGWRLLPAAVLTPLAAVAYAWGAWRSNRFPDPDTLATERPVRVYALCAFRNEMRYLPGLLENLSGTVDGLLALDDGSTDGSGDLVAAHPLTLRLLRNEPASDGSWDEAANQRRLIEAAWETDAGWLVAIDADERLEVDFRERAQAAIAGARDAGHRAYWLHIRELWGAADTYRVDGVWGRKGHLRFFSSARDHEFDTASLHRHWGPMNGRVDGQFIPTDINIYHLRMIREEDRCARRDRYLRLDPDRRWQSIGYEYLTDVDGLELEHLPAGRGYVPLWEEVQAPVGVRHTPPTQGIAGARR